MTYEEAKNDIEFIIKVLNKRRQTPCGFCRSDKCIPNPHKCTADDFVINKAIEALEKQIPKKVTVTTSTKRCPNCKKQVSGKGNSHPERNYCNKCGQALDWSGEDDE